MVNQCDTCMGKETMTYSTNEVDLSSRVLSEEEFAIIQRVLSRANHPRLSRIRSKPIFFKGLGTSAHALASSASASKNPRN